MSKNIYDKMIDVLNERGRTYDASFEDACGAVCLLGARNVIRFGMPFYYKAEDNCWTGEDLLELVELIKEAPESENLIMFGNEPGEWVYTYNDFTHDDNVIIDMLRKASEVYNIRNSEILIEGMANV